MKDWNVVISIYQDGYRSALRLLQKLGSVARTPYHNVVVMRVEDPLALLETVEKRTEEVPAFYDAISRVAPALHSFEFASSRDFEDKTTSALLKWLPQLTGRSFHVRWHRREARHDLHTHDAERYFDDALLDATTKAGAPARVSFTDPDVVIAIDSVDDRAGVALWTRDDLAHHRLLRPD